MLNIREQLYALVDEARTLHHREPPMTLASMRILSQLVGMNAAVNVGMSTGEFAKHIGLTLPQYWRRSQVARVVARFPEAWAMLEAGETHVSHLSIIAPMLTMANADLIFGGIKNKSKREVQELASHVTYDGRWQPREALLDLKLTLTKSQMATIESARNALVHGGRMPSLTEIMMKGAEEILAKHGTAADGHAFAAPVQGTFQDRYTFPAPVQERPTWQQDMKGKHGEQRTWLPCPSACGE